MIKKVGTLKNGVNNMSEVLNTIAKEDKNKLALTVSNGSYYLCDLPNDVSEVSTKCLLKIRYCFANDPEVFGETCEEGEGFISSILCAFPESSRVPISCGGNEFFDYAMDYILSFADSGDIKDKKVKRNYMRLDLKTKEIVFYTNWWDVIREIPSEWN